MATRVLLIRHAAPDSAGRLSGVSDVPLSASGQRQLEQMVERPPARPAPDALFTSPLTRTRTVAAALGRAWGLESRPVGWAREIDCGAVDGLPIERVRREFPDHWARNQAQQDDGFAWPGGETYARFRARVVAGLDGVASDWPAGRLALVTHAGVISQILGLFRGRPACIWEADRPDPLSMTEIVWESGRPLAVLAFNQSQWF